MKDSAFIFKIYNWQGRDQGNERKKYNKKYI